MANVDPYPLHTLLPTPFNLDELLMRIRDLYEPLARDKKVELRVENEQNCSMIADEDRIVQVLFNLTTNAIKFTPKGGHVVIRAVICGNEVRFMVRDTGPGIDCRELCRVFDPDWQSIHAPLGAGLGLFIAKALVDAHGGRIWVESELEVGSTFYFTIPSAGNPFPTTPLF